MKEVFRGLTKDKTPYRYSFISKSPALDILQKEFILHLLTFLLKNG